MIIGSRKYNHFNLITMALFVLPVAVSAQTGPCDLNGDAKVNVVDVQRSIAMYLGSIPCTANIAGSAICTTDVIDRVKTAALGGACVTVPSGARSVLLNWTASTSTGVAGYNIYRSGTSGGQYQKLNAAAIVGTSYTDTTVQSGSTYYYVATAVSTTGTQSAYSNQAQANLQ